MWTVLLASIPGTPSATDVAVTASNANPPQTSKLHARSETHLTRSSRLSWPTRRSHLLLPREHWWLSQAFLVNNHPSIQHCRDRSRQFCKNLCNVLLTSQLSLKVSHSEPSTHLPAVATLALHLPFLGPSRIARQSRVFKEFPQFSCL